MLVPRLNEKLGQQIVSTTGPARAATSACRSWRRRRPTATRSASARRARCRRTCSLYAQMPFDPLKDFKPVAMLAAIPFVIVGNPSRAREDAEGPDRAAPRRTRASSRSGTAATARRCTCRRRCSTRWPTSKLVEVPYKGSGPAALDVLGGQHAARGRRPAFGAAADQGRQADRLCRDQSAAAAAVAGRADGVRSRACPATTRRAGSAWSRLRARPTPIVAAAQRRDQRRAERRVDQGAACATSAWSRRRARAKRSRPTSVRETAKWAKVIKPGQHQARLIATHARICTGRRPRRRCGPGGPDAGDGSGRARRRRSRSPRSAATPSRPT